MQKKEINKSLNNEKKEVSKVIVNKQEKIKPINNQNLTDSSKQNINYEKLNELKKIRIDNTLAHFNKKHLLELKQFLVKLNDLILDSDYGKGASMIIDGDLKAASLENLIFMYKNNHLADLFNENIEINEKIIAKVCNKKYKVIAVSEDEWQTIKKDFNGKKRKFEYIEEKIKLEDIFVPEKDELSSLFGDIIEDS